MSGESVDKSVCRVCRIIWWVRRQRACILRAPTMTKAFATAVLAFVCGYYCGSSGTVWADGLSAPNQSIPPSTNTGRKQGWRRDIDFLVEEIRRQHYVYRSKPLPTAFERRLKRVRSGIDDYSDERMLAELLGL